MWDVDGAEQVADIKDSSGVFVFEGAMADVADVAQVGDLSVGAPLHLT